MKAPFDDRVALDADKLGSYPTEDRWCGEVVMAMDVQRFAAFCDGTTGGNPAGVVLADALPSPEEMQSLAKEVGYSETVFAAPHTDGWSVRFFAPEKEVPFCGHATIALGAALAKEVGNGIYRLALTSNNIVVEGSTSDGMLSAALQSPPTQTEHTSPELIEEVLELFAIEPHSIDQRVPPKIMWAGARHFAVLVNTREALHGFQYEFERGRDWMNANGLTTVLVGYADSAGKFHTRNAFAAGGVYEDAATGAATAALAGYLRELQWPFDGSMTVVQGEDMGCRSIIHAAIPRMLGASIRISGTVRSLD